MEALVHMTGYVGSDVTLRSTTTGVSVADFRLACTPRVLRNEQWADAETTWLTVKAFRALAENVGGSVRRGDPVVVIGRLRTVSWTKDAIIRERLELEANVVGHDLNRGRVTFHRRPADGGSKAEAEGPGDDSELTDGDPFAVGERSDERTGHRSGDRSDDREGELVGAAG